MTTDESNTGKTSAGPPLWLIGCAFIGAALIFVIRNSLLMAGVDSNWQGTFVGVFLIAAVYLGKIRGAKRE